MYILNENKYVKFPSNRQELGKPGSNSDRQKADLLLKRKT